MLTWPLAATETTDTNIALMAGWAKDINTVPCGSPDHRRQHGICQQHRSQMPTWPPVQHWPWTSIWPPVVIQSTGISTARDSISDHRYQPGSSMEPWPLAAACTIDVFPGGPIQNMNILRFGYPAIAQSQVIWVLGGAFRAGPSWAPGYCLPPCQPWAFRAFLTSSSKCISSIDKLSRFGLCLQFLFGIYPGFFEFAACDWPVTFNL